MKYTGIPCAACGKKFTAEDDVVVCPECGTPYHRACYKELGHCVNEARHAEGYVWQPPRPLRGLPYHWRSSRMPPRTRRTAKAM